MPWASCLLMIWFRNGTSLRNIQDKTRSPESRCRGLKVHGSFVLAVSFLFPSLSFFPSLPPTLFPFIPFSSQREEERERNKTDIICDPSQLVCLCVLRVACDHVQTKHFSSFLLFSFVFFSFLFRPFHVTCAACGRKDRTEDSEETACGKGQRYLTEAHHCGAYTICNKRSTIGV